MLIFAAFISIAVEMATADPSHRSTAWIEGVAILVAVALSSGITTVNNYQKEKQFAHLNNVSESRKMVTFFRDGVQYYENQSNLQVGDLVNVDNGMEVPADGILVQAAEI